MASIFAQDSANLDNASASSTDPSLVDWGQRAKRNAAVRGQAGRGATVAGGRRPGAAEPIIEILGLPGFVADLLLERQSTTLLPSCARTI